MKVPHMLGQIATAGIIFSASGDVQKAQEHTAPQKVVHQVNAHDIQNNPAASAETMLVQANSIFADLVATGFITSAEAATFKEATARLEEGDVDVLLTKITDEKAKEGEHKEGYNQLTLLISALALMWFAHMIIGCIKGKPVSFIQHHVPFMAGLLAMSTQIPHEIQHSLAESVIALAMIMGISRVARGVTNDVELKDLSEEQAKTILLVLGPIASVITTPALSTIFAPLRNTLSEKDKYIAMHGVSNVDGAVGIGDFPFLYVWLKKGVVEGALWQAKLMLPIMAFHKVMQAVYFKVGPATVWKHRDLIWKVMTGFKFEGKRLGESHDIVSEETALLKEFLEYIQSRIAELESHMDKDSIQAMEQLIEDETKAIEEISQEEEVSDATQLEEYKILEKELQSVLSDQAFLKDHVSEAVSILRRALADGTLTKEELQQFHNAHHTEALVRQVPGLGGWLRKQEILVDQLYSKVAQKLKFSHNEVEIGKVFTAQALAIGLLVPIISTFLHNLPQATEVVTSLTSSTADNYAATAITWVTDNAKALSFAILAGTLTIYGNMANLNFLGKDANFKQSVQYAKYMLPTLGFAALMTNPGLLKNPTTMIAGAGALSVAGVTAYIRSNASRHI